MTQEIEIPLDLKRVVLMGAEETKLGDKKGALKQYRKGNLHIREYADKFTVHTDKVDPRTDPMGHLIHDGAGAANHLRSPTAPTAVRILHDHCCTVSMRRTFSLLQKGCVQKFGH